MPYARSTKTYIFRDDSQFGYLMLIMCRKPKSTEYLLYVLSTRTCAKYFFCDSLM